MSEITYKIKWSLSFRDKEIEKSTDEFTQKNYGRLLNFLDLYEDRITYSLYGCTMEFLCVDQEAADYLISRIHGLANKKTKDLAISANNLYNSFEVKDILINGPATIVFWADGAKTVVKCGSDDSYDVEKAVAMCFMKKALGSRSMKKLFDLAENKAAEYDNQFKRLELTDLDIYLKNALNTIFNPNPGKLYEGNVTEYKIPEDKDKDKE